MTRTFNWAVLGTAEGGGMETTRIRSIGGWGRGVKELDGPDEVYGVTKDVGDS